MGTHSTQIEIFSTCPPLGSIARTEYSKAVVNAALWSERCGCTGTLVYADNSQVDPWLVSEIIVQNTHQLAPLVAVQPVYMHPYTVAKMVCSLGVLYGRRVYLNLVAGGFKADLIALNDPTPHEERYECLVEYATIIKGLLADHEAITFQGKFFSVEKLTMTPPLPVDLFPGILLSGSSEAGLYAARTLGAVPIHSPTPAKERTPTAFGSRRNFGIRVGMMARATEEAARKEARERFPEEKKEKMIHGLAMKVSDSVWRQELSSAIEENKTNSSCYWLPPFENYKTSCPYLVGSYEQVGEELARYLALGCRTFILDVPLCEQDLRDARIAFDLACYKSNIADSRSTLREAQEHQEGLLSSQPACAERRNPEKAAPIQG